jgi:hypothetical protein
MGAVVAILLAFVVVGSIGGGGAGADPLAGRKGDPFVGQSTGPQPDALGVSSIGFGVKTRVENVVHRTIEPGTTGRPKLTTGPVSVIVSNPLTLTATEAGLLSQGAIAISGGVLYPSNADGSVNVAWLRALPTPYGKARTADDLFKMAYNPVAEYERHEPMLWIPGHEHTLGDDGVRPYVADLNPAWLVFAIVYPGLMQQKIDPSRGTSGIPGWVPATFKTVASAVVAAAQA